MPIIGEKALGNYIALHPNGQSTVVWCLEKERVYRPGTTEDFRVPAGTDPWEVVLDGRADWKYHKLNLAPGEYYPRMARPNNSYPEQSPGTNPGNQSNKTLIETGRGQLVALREQLERIFRTVHPVTKNFECYGHEIRNLLILAATEVEGHWKGVLKANGVEGQNTMEYVKLLGAMRLAEYEVRLPFYPWMAPVNPFKDWNIAQPTKSLVWYDAYNAVKHDRETEFEKGTLQRAIEAVCGCAVMTFGQFGTHGFHYRELITSFFELASAPKWKLSEVYTFPYGEAKNKEILFKF